MQIQRRTLIAIPAVGLLVFLLWFLTRDGRSPEWLAKNYGITSAYADQVLTPEGKGISATVVPVTLPNGQPGQLIVPQKRSDRSLYLRDSRGQLLPVRLADRASSRDEFVRSDPTVVERRVETTPKRKRSPEREVLIVGGSAGAGAAIGAAAGGKKGAGIGALSGGIAGLIYDMATRN